MPKEAMIVNEINSAGIIKSYKNLPFLIKTIIVSNTGATTGKVETIENE
jgi:hypothetical protein